MVRSKAGTMPPEFCALLDPVEPVFQEVQDIPSKVTWAAPASGVPDTGSQGVWEAWWTL